jgi:hypothetical protein
MERLQQQQSTVQATQPAQQRKTVPKPAAPILQQGDSADASQMSGTIPQQALYTDWASI